MFLKSLNVFHLFLWDMTFVLILSVILLSWTSIALMPYEFCEKIHPGLCLVFYILCRYRSGSQSVDGSCLPGFCFAERLHLVLSCLRMRDGGLRNLETETRGEEGPSLMRPCVPPPPDTGSMRAEYPVWKLSQQDFFIHGDVWIYFFTWGSEGWGGIVTVKKQWK